MKTALLLIAHGSRRNEANEDLDHLAARIRSQGQYDLVQTSYLELAEPCIVTSGRLCVEQGAERIIMLPYFLSPGVHVREDLVKAQMSLRAQFPEVEFLLGEPLGGHPLLLEIVVQRAREALQFRLSADPKKDG